MLQDLVQYGPFGTELFEAADRLLADMLPRPLSSYIYPLPAFDRAARKRAKAELDDTRIAQPAIGLVSLFACDVLTRFGLRPAVTAGHSYGEYTALCVAGYTGREELLRMSAFRGRAVHEAGEDHPGGMVAVAASAEDTQAALAERGVAALIANINGPSQTIIAGSTEAMEAALAQLREHGLAVRRVAVTAPFHTAAMEEPSRALGDYVKQIETRLPRIPVYSNVTAAPYPDDLEAIREQLAVHLARPVRFVEQIRAMHRDGARVFLEVGPGRILTGLVQRILSDEPHHAIALDMSGQPGWLRLGHLLAQTHALGLPVEMEPWFEGRGLDDVSTEAVLHDTRNREEVKPTDWVLAPGAVRPAATPARDAGSVAAEVSHVSDPARPRAMPGDPVDPAPSVQSAASSPGAQSTATTPGPAGHAGAVSQQAPQAQAANPERPATTPTPAAHPLQTQIQDALNKWLDLQREQLRLTERFLALQERVVAGAVPDIQWPAAAPTRAEPVSATSTALNVAPAPVLPDLRPTPPLPARDGDITDSLGADPAAPETRPAAAPGTAPSGAETPSGRSDDADGTLPSVAAFRRDLLHEVSQRTGYPEDMLGLDVPLEASLGIDSIKTMEIFSALKPYHSILAAGSDDEEEVLAEFAQMKTLQDIIDRFSSRRERLADGEMAQSEQPAPDMTRRSAAEQSALGEPADSADARELSGDDESETAPGVTHQPMSETTKEAEAARVERLVLRSVSAPVNGDGQGGLLALPEDQSVVILGEAPEVASSLEAALASTGRGAYRIIPGKKTRRISPCRYEADLSNRAALQKLAREMRKHETTRIGCLVNLLSLDGSFREPGLNGQEAPLLLVRWLTNVAQVFEDDLRASGKDGAGYLVNVTTLDGHFGLRGARSLPVAQAGSLGFFKSLGREWRGIKVRNIDLDPEADPGALVLSLLRELAESDGLLEVGLDGERRWRLDLVSSRVSSETGDTAGGLGLGPESVVLATGGAYGITAAVLERLARETGARLVIVGRSDLRTPEDEDPEIRQIHERSALRAWLIERARTQEPSPSPAAIERDLQRIEKDRAIRANLAALRAAGSEVEYHAIDVRDADAFGALIDDLYGRYGRIDGALHGAGVVEDRWLRDKTPESLARVFETKANAAQILARKLRPEGLRFLVFFSSVSGRFGNAGQADYSAANEYLNKLADHLDREWPGRVVAVNWGPWESGMVSDGLRLAYAHRGIRLIEAEAGARALLAELGQVDSRVPEVILTCSPDRIAELASYTHEQ
jgi:malonyl CoA-acyl carrier protein transacylase/NAD(P)-dependent dehydrogenase (short-subunit alcohol dehydrogenase family)